MNKTFEFMNSKAIWKNRIPLLSREDSIAFIDLCKAENIRILGIDAFILHPDGRIQPVSADSTDYSYTKTKNWHESRQFLLSKKNENYYYEIVADEYRLRRDGINLKFTCEYCKNDVVFSPLLNRTRIKCPACGFKRDFSSNRNRLREFILTFSGLMIARATFNYLSTDFNIFIRYLICLWSILIIVPLDAWWLYHNPRQKSRKSIKNIVN